jgi:hypothetical protein
MEAAMPTLYTIYLQNQSADTETFWCFLAPPEALADDPGVYANSSASLAVAPNDPGINSFVIPIQYIVGAGASNQAVGLNVEIISNVTNPAALLDTWDANYMDAPPNEGPAMAKTAAQAPANNIAIVSNGFDKVANEDAGWFSNQSFGIQSEAGFIGMSWSPEPQQTRTIMPLLTFYVATGDYGSNALAEWDDVSTGSATVQVPADFSLNECTVTYTATGSWVVTPGKPAALAMVQNLEFFRSPAHEELVALAYLANGSGQSDTLESVNWDSTTDDDGEGNTYLTGTITVGTALTAAFSFFILSNIQFTVTKPAKGGTAVRFSYSGTQSKSFIQGLFTSGVQLLFGGAK